MELNPTDMIENFIFQMDTLITASWTQEMFDSARSRFFILLSKI